MAASKLEDFTTSRATLLLDGAVGTELTRRGVATPLPLWGTAALIERPEAVREIHADYLRAGADLIVANTFRTNPRALRAGGKDRQGPALNRLAISLAREAVASVAPHRGVIVCGSMAPVEDCYRPDLAPPDAELVDEHRRHARWLADADADWLWIETQNSVREARAAASAAVQADLPFIVCFVTTESGNLLSGESLASAVAAIKPFGPLAVGLNCIPPAGLTRILRLLRDLTDLPLITYGHIGNPEPLQGWSFSESMSPEEYATHAMDWIALGARIVGGCCGTTPAHVKKIGDLLRPPT